MGEIIVFKEDEITKIVVTARREKEILLEELSATKSEFKHMLALRNNEIDQLKFSFDADLARIDREYRQKGETSN